MDFTYTSNRVISSWVTISTTHKFRDGFVNGIIHAMKTADKECLITVTVTAVIWLLAIVAILV